MSSSQIYRTGCIKRHCELVFPCEVYQIVWCLKGWLPQNVAVSKCNWCVFSVSEGRSHNSHVVETCAKYIHKCMHTYPQPCMHTCMHTCMRAYIHTYIHTYVHTYTMLCDKYLETAMFGKIMKTEEKKENPRWIILSGHGRLGVNIRFSTAKSLLIC